MEPLISFNDMSAFATADAETIGNKAYRLYKLHQLGFAIPESWVIPVREFAIHISQILVAQTIEACDLGKDDNSWRTISRAIIEAPLRHQLIDALSNASRLWFATSDPRSLAIRSSANKEDTQGHSFAGIFSSTLDVRDLSEVLNAVKHCWASVWSDRAQAYCRKFRLEQSSISMALLIQYLIPARSAGVLYTRDPVYMDRNAIVIEAANCAGEKVVSGHVSPVCFRLSTLNGSTTIQNPNAGNMIILSDENLKWLSSIAHAIRDYFSDDQEIEWAFDFQGNGYVLQTRPITTKSFMSEQNHS